MFFRTPSILPILYPKLIWRIPDSTNKIFLTFDDGPVPGPTNFVLDELKKVNAKATFFCIGNNVVENNVLFQSIKASGHKVGNHTYSHLKGWNVSNDKYYQDVAACQEVLGGTKLFRPPYGRIKRSQIKQLSNFNIIMWDVLAFDYAKTMSPERCLKGVLGAVRSGSIVVFHDSYKAEKNLQHALPRVLDHFSNLGFAFEVLPEL